MWNGLYFIPRPPSQAVCSCNTSCLQTLYVSPSPWPEDSLASKYLSARQAYYLGLELINFMHWVPAYLCVCPTTGMKNIFFAAALKLWVKFAASTSFSKTCWQYFYSQAQAQLQPSWSGLVLISLCSVNFQLLSPKKVCFTGIGLWILFKLSTRC